MSRVRAAYAGIDAVDRPEVWIALRPEAEVQAEHDAALAAGGPLAGLLLAVKGNVDVAGIPTTAGCPTYAAGPAAADATAVARLRATGASVLGVANLDQFATGLVGQRSPYGGVRDARRPAYVSGGSSSGSAVAVALGLADVAIGTDTAGSGRVPAAFQGIVGIKPTLGVVSTAGVVPACRSWDAVTVFARDLDTAEAAMGAMAGGPGTRPWPADAPLAAPPGARVAVPDDLLGLAPAWAAGFAASVERLRAAGCTVEAISFAPFLEAARLLYDGALVAERHAAVGAFVDAHRDDPDAGLDPTVAAIIARAGSLTGSAMVRDLARLEELGAVCASAMAGYDALLVPTAPGHPTREAVAADPVGVNSWLGTWTNFCNLLDLCAVAVPAGTVDEGPAGPAQLGVTVLARPFHDAVAADLARLVLLAPEPVAAPGAAAPLPRPGVPWSVMAGASSVPLLVVGAHRRGQPLEHELTSRGARWAGTARTSAAYRLLALDTVPPKPGLVRAAPGAGGVGVVGELWQLPVAALGDFLSALPAPMALGRVELEDGTWVTGFGCAADAAASGRDISEHGDWVRYLEAVAAGG
ncbi:allophanate hydrolase [Nocardioides sp. SOB77]|uniref:Allophanate hydrolase n=1 Tax=Nocardioides oceani TaxID=3058369 RepID=A0ABT8FA93_9ACTN|nr:allophanate hydrolase [Nocardioides oceani]MDN4171536.1 allophanate hydrolase [Nocardioides oceani]